MRHGVCAHTVIEHYYGSKRCLCSFAEMDKESVIEPVIGLEN